MTKRTMLFDVDGVLSGPRQHVPLHIRTALKQVAEKYSLVIVSGSDLQKIEEQFEHDDDCLSLFSKIYTCLGNACYSNDDKHYLYLAPILEDSELKVYLDKLVGFYEGMKYGNHVEPRSGMINFSLVGRNADQQARFKYAAADTHRYLIAKILADKFPKYQFLLGGEISIDITIKGKEQLVEHEDLENCIFFADKVTVGGNDYALTREIISQRGLFFYITDGPKQTLDILNEYMDRKI